MELVWDCGSWAQLPSTLRTCVGGSHPWPESSLGRGFTDSPARAAGSSASAGNATVRYSVTTLPPSRPTSILMRLPSHAQLQCQQAPPCCKMISPALTAPRLLQTPNGVPSAWYSCSAAVMSGHSSIFPSWVPGVQGGRPWECRSLQGGAEASGTGGQLPDPEEQGVGRDAGGVGRDAGGVGRDAGGIGRDTGGIGRDTGGSSQQSGSRSSNDNFVEASSCQSAASSGQEKEGYEAAESNVGTGGAGASHDATDWRSFRARLVASERADVRARPGDGGLGVSETLGEADGDIGQVELEKLWAHAIYAPEKGCLLVASELLHGYNFFQRSVILLLGVGTGPSDGPYGIALNKPFPRTVAQVDSMLPGIATTLGSCQVHVGGPIGPRTVLLVHGHKGLDGHCEVLPGVFVSGLAGCAAATSLVEGGAAKPEDFQVVLGYAGWGEEQLRQEIAQGWWYVAACSTDVVLQAKKRCSGKEGDAVWKEVLDLMGGEYAEVGNRSLGEDI